MKTFLKPWLLSGVAGACNNTSTSWIRVNSLVASAHKQPIVN